MMNTDMNLDVISEKHPTSTSLKFKWLIIIGIEIPRYANTKFSQIYPAASIKCSIVI